jgi:tetratricopeptide (TPR) repeat protein
MFRARILVLLLCLAATYIGNVSAQVGTPLPPEDRLIRELEETDRRIFLARKLIRNRDFQKATDLLETEYEQDPDNAVVQNLLRTCYDQLKQYDKAELLVRRMIQKHPRALGHRLRLAEVLMRQGSLEEATVAYQDAADIIGEEDPRNYRSLIRSMMNSGLDEQALARIEERRRATGNPHVLALERGSILKERRQYRLAAGEYLTVLIEDSTAEAGRAEKELMQLLEFGESTSEVEEILIAFVDSTSGARAMKLLTDHFLLSGKFEDAFTFALRQDSLESSQGVHLISFIHQCQDRELWGEVVRMAAYYLSHYVGTEMETDVLFKYAAALANTGRGEEAIAAYERIRRLSQHHGTTGDALYGIGVVYFDYLGDYPQALVYFDSVVTYFPRGLSYLHSLKSIPQCYLRAGRLDAAAEKFAGLLDMNLGEDDHEEAAFFLALVSFFEERYDSAEVAFRKLMVDYPRGYFVNDALQLVLVIDEASDNPALLSDFSDALYFDQRGMFDSTRARLGSLADSQPRTLADFALFRLARLELQASDSAAALTAIDRLIDRFPDSYYLPLGMKMKADMLIRTETGLEEAKTLYRYLLENYPDYPFATDVRETLRRLETDYTIG